MLPAAAGRGPDTPRERGRLARLVGPAHLVVLVTTICGVLISTYAFHGYVFPVGADAPVYIWWSRLAALEGLGAVAGRPGAPGFTLVVSGVLGTGAATTVAALEVALAGAIASGIAALMLGRPATLIRWLLPAALGGAFSALLAIGYVATLAAAALFIPACGLLAGGGRYAVGVAAALLAAMGLTHPPFLAIGASILLLAAALSLRRDPRIRPILGTEHGRLATAVLAGSVGFAGAMVSVGTGAAPILVDTSRDDVLQRLGLGSTLGREFRERLVARAPTLVPWLSVPLAILGARAEPDALGRLLRAWGAVSVAGVLGGLATGAVPPERFVTFGFVIPVTAGAALAALPGRLRARGREARAALGPALALASAALISGPLLVWFRTPPQLFPLEVQRTTEAGRYAAALAPGTPLVFVAKNRQPVGAFFATEAANAIRAALPPDRIRDVYVVTPSGPPLADSPENAQLVTSSLAAATRDPGAVWFDLAPFNRTGFGGPLPGGRPPAAEVGTGVAIDGALPAGAGTEPAVDPLAPLTTGGLVFAVAGTLVVCTVPGSGWARATGRGMRAFALSPASGAGALVLGAVVGDRAGVDLSGRAGPVAIAAVVTIAGHAAAFASRRSDPPVPALPSPP